MEKDGHQVRMRSQNLAEHKHKQKKDEDEDNLEEGDARAAEVGKAHADHAEFEKKEKAKEAKEAAEADFKARFNTNDGLLHNKDGTLQDPTDGTII